MTAARWLCPQCGRRFGRPNRPHTCAPALSLDAYFAGRTPEQRRIFDAVAAHMAELDGVDVEAVSVGILFKASRTFAELRPRREGMGLTLLLARELRDPRVRRTLRAGAGRVAHVVPLRSAGEVDAAIRAWLTEAYLGASA